MFIRLWGWPEKLSIFCCRTSNFLFLLNDSDDSDDSDDFDFYFTNFYFKERPRSSSKYSTGVNYSVKLRFTEEVTMIFRSGNFSLNHFSYFSKNCACSFPGEHSESIMKSTGLFCKFNCINSSSYLYGKFGFLIPSSLLSRLCKVSYFSFFISR